MTGFGAADGSVGAVRVEIEARSVNHRFFSPSVRLPTVFARWETDVRDMLRAHVARGHVTLSVRVEREFAAAGRVRLDTGRLADYAAAYQAMVTSFGAPPMVSFTDVLRLPGVLLDDDAERDASQVTSGNEVADRAALLRIVEVAAVQLTAVRAAGGERIAAVLRERLALVAAAFDRIAARAPERLAEQRVRLHEAVREITGLTLSEERVAQEIALLVDRVDVSEEVDRFRVHVAAFRAALDADDAEPVGKRLGFLLQEMLRETNTTGSKANDGAMLRDVLLVKEELERIREQVENVE
ncbi:MAG: YicC family protein [Candidatus Eremiobacteraeota bacterium]|nr:YicC family protein [Candidatus Eremiobacteraeota bacterium]